MKIRATGQSQDIDIYGTMVDYDGGLTGSIRCAEWPEVTYLVRCDAAGRLKEVRASASRDIPLDALTKAPFRRMARELQVHFRQSATRIASLEADGLTREERVWRDNIERHLELIAKSEAAATKPNKRFAFTAWLSCAAQRDGVSDHREAVRALLERNRFEGRREISGANVRFWLSEATRLGFASKPANTRAPRELLPRGKRVIQQVVGWSADTETKSWEALKAEMAEGAYDAFGLSRRTERRARSSR